MSSRTRYTSVGLTVLVFFGVLVVSCNEVERYKVLTFLFDGVTPPRQEGLRDKSIDLDSQGLAQTRPKQIWYAHEPRKDCTLCHGKREQRRFSLQMHLIAPVPKLCYDCHTDYTISASFVHGPVAVGQCLFCHNPHKSKIEHLLKEPEPKLCYLCHDIGTVESTPAHLPGQLTGCTDCHDPHASSTRALLTVASSQRNEELDVAKTIGAALGDYIQAAKEQDAIGPSDQAETTHITGPETRSLFDVLWGVSELVEQGELQEARAYLEELRDSSNYTDEERGKIAQVLRLMDTATTKTEQRFEKINQETPVNKQKAEEPAAKPAKGSNQPGEQKREIAKLYYHSMAFYRAGQLVRAREGFAKVLKSGLVPAPMTKTIRGYLLDIDNTLAEGATPPDSEQ